MPISACHSSGGRSSSATTIPTWFTGAFVSVRIATSASERPRNSHRSPVAAPREGVLVRQRGASGIARTLRGRDPALEAPRTRRPRRRRRDRRRGRAQAARARRVRRRTTCAPSCTTGSPTSRRTGTARARPPASAHPEAEPHRGRSGCPPRRSRGSSAGASPFFRPRGRRMKASPAGARFVEDDRRTQRLPRPRWSRNETVAASESRNRARDGWAARKVFVTIRAAPVIAGAATSGAGGAGARACRRGRRSRRRHRRRRRRAAVDDDRGGGALLQTVRRGPRTRPSRRTCRRRWTRPRGRA